jgi:hypothetical protein
MKSKLLLMPPALLIMTGCQILSPQIDKAAKAAGKMVTFYCDNVTVPEIREEFRAKVNAAASPNSVQVQCASGGPVLKTGN